MGSPAGMGNTCLAAEVLAIRKFAQFRNAAGGTQPVQPAVVKRDPGGIVAPVFQAAQAFKQGGNNITCCDCADYSTHLMASFYRFGEQTV